MPKEEFNQIALLEDPQDRVVLAPITVRETPDGRKYSFALLREFIRDNAPARTCWFQRRHIAALRRTLDEVENWYEAEEKRQRKESRR